MLSHTGEKPHACKQCPKRFQLKSSLREHELSHEISHPFACHKCGVTYRHRKTLARHMQKLHSMNNNAPLAVKCSEDGCGKTFARRDVYLSHLDNVHSTSRFLCGECGKSLSSKRSLMNHVARLHKREYARMVCPYGMGCELLNKDSAHESEFSHTPACPYGKSCHFFQVDTF
eukprot:g34819.t1